MKKRIVLILCMALLTSTMFGCADAPNSVKNREKQYADRTELTTENMIHRTTVNHLLDNKEELLSKQYQNLELPKHISARLPESVCVLHTKLASYFSKNMERFFTLFYKESVYKNIVETIPPERANETYVDLASAISLAENKITL